MIEFPPKVGAWRTVLCLVTALAACGEAADPARTMMPAPEATPGALAVPAVVRSAGAFEASCVTKPGSVLKVKSQVSGEVTKVFVNVGDAVLPGQPLLEISLRDVQLQIQRVDIAEQRVRARLEAQRLQLARGEREAQAVQGLYSDTRLAKETTSMQVQRLQVQESELELKDLALQRADLKRQIGNAHIAATGAGTILQRNVEPGQVIGAAIGVASGGDVLLEIGDLSQMVMECAVHQSDAQYVVPGKTLYANLGGRSGRWMDARIIRVSPAIEMVGGVAQLKFLARPGVETSDGRGLLPGMRLIASSDRKARGDLND